MKSQNNNTTTTIYRNIKLHLAQICLLIRRLRRDVPEGQARCLTILLTALGHADRLLDMLRPITSPEGGAI